MAAGKRDTNAPCHLRLAALLLVGSLVLFSGWQTLRGQAIPAEDEPTAILLPGVTVPLLLSTAGSPATVNFRVFVPAGSDSVCFHVTDGNVDALALSLMAENAPGTTPPVRRAETHLGEGACYWDRFQTPALPAGEWLTASIVVVANTRGDAEALPELITARVRVELNALPPSVHARLTPNEPLALTIPTHERRFASVLVDVPAALSAMTVTVEVASAPVSVYVTTTGVMRDWHRDATWQCAIGTRSGELNIPNAQAGRYYIDVVVAETDWSSDTTLTLQALCTPRDAAAESAERD